MKIVAMSDTHGLHAKLTVPDGDVLIHAGDFSRFGKVEDIYGFLDWFGRLPHRHKILVAGNHDRLFEDNPVKAKELLWPSITYLQDKEAVIDGVKFYGAPWTPRFFDWAFNVDRGSDIAKKWAKIPDDVNVLITHGPPFGICDMSRFQSSRMGCEDLLRRIEQLGELKVHIFGHNHSGHGVQGMFANVAVCDEAYQPVNQPTVIEI